MQRIPCIVVQWIPTVCTGVHEARPNASRLNAVDFFASWPKASRLNAGDSMQHDLMQWPSAPLRAKEGLGCLWLRGHCCLAGGLLSWKPTPNVFPFAEKADLAGRSPVCTGPSNPPIASSGPNHLGPSCETAQNPLL